MEKHSNRSTKKVLWIHNWPKKVASGGGWMYNQHEFLKDEVDIYFLNNLRNPITFIKHLFHLRKLSRDYPIVHAQYGSAVGLIASLMPCRRILSLKGSDWYKADNKTLLGRIRVLLGKTLTDISIRRFDHIIVMSDAMKAEVLDKYPNSRITTLVDPIDLSKFKPMPVDRKSSTKRILFASIQVDKPVKRFQLAKEAFNLLHMEIPKTELVVMSKIPHEEVAKFMNCVDVLLLTSAHEGWPNVVKEMLACNKPFVSTDVSDLTKIAEQTKSCFVCEPNPESLKEGLIKALSSDEEDLRKFVEEFSMENILNSLKKIYRSYLT